MTYKSANLKKVLLDGPMPAASGSNLYEAFDSPSHNNHIMEEDSHMNANGTFLSYAGSAFDSMLEILPDAADFSLFSSNANSQDLLNGDNSNEQSASNVKSATTFPIHMDQDEALSHNGFNNIFGQPTKQYKDEPTEPTGSAESTQPLDMANQQNGEIAQLWNFNVDELMMTPSGSNSATISAPNSYNSETVFQPGSAPGGPLMSSLNMNPSNELFGHPMSVGNNNNFSQFLSLGVPYPNLSTSSYFNQSASSSPRNGGSQVTLKKEEIGNSYRPPLNGRRSSSQINKMYHTEDGGIPLSSTATGNSVRKNSLARQMSSTSLSNYKRGSTSSITEMQKKPPLLCFNCKTQKTPLWRRDSHGNTLCNACGLFQKLHGTMRPLSLKTDVIKKRNNKKRAKKLQEQAEKNAAMNDNSNNNRSNDDRTNNNATTNGARIQPKPTKARRNTNQRNPLLTDGISPLPESPSGNRFDLGYSESPANGSFSTLSHQQSLNPNTLMTHSTRTSNVTPPIVKKPRRGSTSSNTSSSSKSSTRSLVPILPKPTSAGNQAQFNSNSANNSAASSPRVAGSNFNGSSPMTASQGQLSSSTGRQGITIPRRKSSRNQSSSSSSFMAASLQQLQQQNQQQQQQQYNNSTSASLSNNWSQTSMGASPKSTRSPKAGFDLFESPGNSPGFSGTASRRSHTSLLSQQLQKSEQFDEKLKIETNAMEISVNSYSQQPSPMAHTTSVKRSPITASPRNSYADSLMQHRGVPDPSFRRQSSLTLRRTVSSREQTLSPSSETARNPTIITTPLPSTTVTAVTATDNGDDAKTPGLRSNISDELDWLKFGM